MKLSRVVIVVAVIVVIVIAAFVVYSFLVTSAPECTSTWQCAAGYPIQVGGVYAVAGIQCVNSSTYITCIGGGDANGGPRNEVFTSSAISSSSINITGWVQDTNSYPQSIDGQSCTAYSGFVYCVGGSYDDSGDDVASSYYAPMESGGTVGTWNSTTSYPIPIDSQSCVASGGFIYCVGGENETDGTSADVTPSGNVWFAPISSSGIGAWSSSTAYPSNVYYPSCFTANSYIYCLGGADSNDNSLSVDYYASLSSTGIGTWTPTTSYLQALTSPACAISSGIIYCVGGETSDGSSPTYTNAVYYAPVSSGGIGTWKRVANFPISVWTECTISSGYMYCVGGFDGSSVGADNVVHYASLASLSA